MWHIIKRIKAANINRIRNDPGVRINRQKFKIKFNSIKFQWKR